jgi:hypothetical protein
VVLGVVRGRIALVSLHQPACHLVQVNGADCLFALIVLLAHTAVALVVLDALPVLLGITSQI